MMTQLLTEAEFHLFTEQLDSFTQQLRPKVRGILIDILLRAPTVSPFDRPGAAQHPDSFMTTSFAYAL